jgi:hypothetical protein
MEIELIDKKFESIGRVLNNALYTFRIKNTHTSFANAMKIICTDDIPIKHLELKELKTGDEYIKFEELQLQLRKIPIIQTLAEGTEVSLHVKNPYFEIANVTTSLLKPENICNDMQIYGLHPQQELYFIALVKEFNGYDNGCYHSCLAYLKTDEISGEIEDEEQKTGNIIMMVETNGDVNIAKLINSAIESLKSRLKFVQTLEGIMVNGIFEVTIPNENDAIGGIIQDEFDELFPEIGNVYQIPFEGIRTVKYKIELDDLDKSLELFRKVCKHLYDKIDGIKVKME